MWPKGWFKCSCHDWRWRCFLHEQVKPFNDATVVELFRVSSSWTPSVCQPKGRCGRQQEQLLVKAWAHTCRTLMLMLMLLILMQAWCTYSQVRDSWVLYSLVWLHWGSTSLFFFYQGTDTLWSSRLKCTLMLAPSVIMVSPQASNK